MTDRFDSVATSLMEARTYHNDLNVGHGIERDIDLADKILGALITAVAELAQMDESGDGKFTHRRAIDRHDS